LSYFFPLSFLLFKYFKKKDVLRLFFLGRKGNKLATKRPRRTAALDHPLGRLLEVNGGRCGGMGVCPAKEVGRRRHPKADFIDFF